MNDLNPLKLENNIHLYAENQNKTSLSINFLLRNMVLLFVFHRIFLLIFRLPFIYFPNLTMD